MTDVKRLLDEAAPLPWVKPLMVRQMTGDLADQRRAHANEDLIVHAVNRVPDYEAAVDALEQCNRALALRPPDPTEVDVATAAARAALARLRGKVAADV